jgi:hypothetical protein
MRILMVSEHCRTLYTFLVIPNPFRARSLTEYFSLFHFAETALNQKRVL